MRPRYAKPVRALAKCLDSFVSYECFGDLNAVVEDIVYDTRRQGKVPTLFCALKGTHHNGIRFCQQAVSQGARAILCASRDKNTILSQLDRSSSSSIPSTSPSSPQSTRLRKPSLIMVHHDQVTKAMALISSFFYDEPQTDLVTIGITGTDGKSTTVHFIHQLLASQHIKHGFWSTVQSYDGITYNENAHRQSTPESPDLYKALACMRDNGCTHAVLEATSHGLSPITRRMEGIEFDIALVTNIESEHLDFHKTRAQYIRDKSELFKKIKAMGTGIINADKKDMELFYEALTWNCRHLVQFYHHTQTNSARTHISNSYANTVNSNSNIQHESWSYSTIKAEQKKQKTDKENTSEEQPITQYVSLTRDAIVHNGSYSIKKSPYNSRSYPPQETFAELQYTTHLLGSYNIENMIQSLLVLHALGIPLYVLKEPVKYVQAPKGRLQILRQNTDYTCIIDYAHTPQSFSSLFPLIKDAFTGAPLTVVFGSAGERDKEKRSLQGSIAGKWANTIILTDEDPRLEEPMNILNDIASGCVSVISETSGTGTSGTGTSGTGTGVPKHRLHETLFLIPNRQEAIDFACAQASPGDVLLFLGKAHEKSIEYAHESISWDEEKAIKEAITKAQLNKTRANKIKTGKAKTL